MSYNWALNDVHKFLLWLSLMASIEMFRWPIHCITEKNEPDPDFAGTTTCSCNEHNWNLLKLIGTNRWRYLRNRKDLIILFCWSVLLGRITSTLSLKTDGCTDALWYFKSYGCWELIPNGSQVPLYIVSQSGVMKT